MRDALTTVVKKTKPTLVWILKSTISILKDFFEYNFSGKHGTSVLHASEFIIALIEGVVNTAIRFFKFFFIKLPKAYMEAFDRFLSWVIKVSPGVWACVVMVSLIIKDLLVDCAIR